MSDIGVGDWVECVDASPMNVSNLPSNLVAGALYCVEKLSYVPRGYKNSGNPLIGLVGVRSPNWGAAQVKGCFGLWRFRPIRDDKRTVTRAALVKERA